MSTRRPLQPLSPLSANIASAKHNTHITKDGTDGVAIMDEQMQDIMQGSGSVVSDLTDLENDADDFDKLMIQNARDERRLNDVLQGRVQPFRKARTHPRIGVTLENLERHNARNNGALEHTAHVKFESPPSSSGSARSDPAIHAPTGWGRKARTNRNWLRTITTEEEQTAGAQDDTVNRLTQDEDMTPRRADIPRPSIEDSPLSHKTSLQGTPSSTRRRAANFERIDDWDITMDLNEASLIASTPYIPRNTALDEIRQREIESLREQGVTTSRLDQIRGSSPEETRRPRSSSARSTNSQTNGVSTSEQTIQRSASQEPQLRKRTNSWQKVDKSQAVNGDGTENSPIVVYNKSLETVGMIDRGLHASAQANSKRPTNHRREDSQDLLRRLARVSSTPSPGRISAARPHTAPARPSDSSSRTMATEISAAPLSSEQPYVEKSIQKSNTTDSAATAPEIQSYPTQPTREQRHSGQAPEAIVQLQAADVDATPMPVEQSILNPKTPIVTGAWIDTPGPRTARMPDDSPRPRSQSPKKGSPSKPKSPEKQPVPTPEEGLEAAALKTMRPTLPRSALAAILEEARANGRRYLDDLGDSTINSLEEIIAPSTNPETGEVDEDTLQGLQLPTEPPRNEAERRRQQELLQLHSMNQRLHAARTSIRDASRGIRRVENRVEHKQEIVEDGETENVVKRDCPCVVDGGHLCEFSTWRWFQSFFWQKKLKILEKRRFGLTGWGITGFAVFLILLSMWFIAENIACDYHCQPLYASWTPWPYGVHPNPAKFPFVLPTLFYRTFMRAWWIPLWSFLTWTWRTAITCIFGGVNEATATGTIPTKPRTRIWSASSQVAEDLGWDLSMMNDELARGDERL